MKKNIIGSLVIVGLVATSAFVASEYTKKTIEENQGKEVAGIKDEFENPNFDFLKSNKEEDAPAPKKEEDKEAAKKEASKSTEKPKATTSQSQKQVAQKVVQKTTPKPQSVPAKATSTAADNKKKAEAYVNKAFDIATEAMTLSASMPNPNTDFSANVINELNYLKEKIAGLITHANQMDVSPEASTMKANLINMCSNLSSQLNSHIKIVESSTAAEINKAKAEAATYERLINENYNAFKTEIMKISNKYGL